jgi:hypothetical protein
MRNKRFVSDLSNKIIESMKKDGEWQKMARRSFKRLLAKTQRGPNPNTSPYTKKAYIGKSGPVGMP